MASIHGTFKAELDEPLKVEHLYEVQGEKPGLPPPSGMPPEIRSLVPIHIGDKIEYESPGTIATVLDIWHRPGPDGKSARPILFCK